MNKTLLTIVLVVVAAGAGLAGWYYTQKPANQVQGQQNNPAPTPLNQVSNDITVTSPLPNQIITSPLVISGEARGSWYFEASFPVEIYDANWQKLGQSYAQAQWDWMTENFVSFIAKITFTHPSTDTGWLVFKKDNPSGLPENDARYELLVKFKN